MARVSDFGRNDTTFITRTHLGGFLNAGDSCMGYDLTNLNANDESFDKMNAERCVRVHVQEYRCWARR